MYETVKVIRLSDMDEVNAWYDWSWRKEESSGLLRWKE